MTVIITCSEGFNIRLVVYQNVFIKVTSSCEVDITATYSTTHVFGRTRLDASPRCDVGLVYVASYRAGRVMMRWSGILL